MKPNSKKGNEKEKQQNRMKLLVLGTIALVVVVVLIVTMFSGSSTTPASPTTTPFAYDKLPVQGDPNAPIKIVEFGDYKCPSCQYFSKDIKPQIEKDFIDKGIVAFYFMNYPIISPDADSTTAAIAAQSVFHQNKDAFWPYYHAIYNNQGDEKETWATPDFLTELARQKNLSVNYDQLKQEITSMKYKVEVNEQSALAEKIGVTGTPTLFINGQKVEDVFNYEAIKAEIEKAQKHEK